MAHSAAGYYRKQKWYNKNIFPLVPIIEVKKEDKHNTSGFTFRWLFITLWTLDSFQFELSITVDTHWGLGFKGMIPYLRWVVSIPCSEKLGININERLSRKVENNEDEKR